jgi:ferric-dicitrate binding protein FerR (iron transport regulator)
MNPVSRLFHALSARRARSKDRGLASLERALESQREKLLWVDPETAQQWRLVQLALRRPEAARRVPVKLRALRPALALGLAVAGVLLVILLPDRNPALIEHETGRGQHTTVMLADSTQITLNHTSKLTIGGDAGVDGRTVALEGEAYFRVRRTGAPFIVTTDLGSVEVLGTEFNVRDRDGRLEVAVVSGSVRVTSGSSGEVVVLKAGELTRCTRRDGPEKPAPLRYAEYPGWLHGKILFDRATLGEACREIEDYFDVTVTIALPVEERATITGAVDARTPDAAVTTLARLTGHNYRHDQSGYTFY